MSFKLSSLSKTFMFAFISFVFILSSTPFAAAATTLEDGEYTLNYEILHGDANNNSTSMADGYWNKPAKVIVKDGVIHIRTTINKSKWVTAFSTKYNGSFVDTKIVSSNESNDSRVTEFKVANIDDILDAKMSVFVPEIDYDHSYSVRFKFYADSLKLTSAAATAAPTATPAATAAPAPTKQPEPAKETAAQPATTSKPAATVATGSKENPSTIKETPASNGGGQSSESKPEETPAATVNPTATEEVAATAQPVAEEPIVDEAASNEVSNDEGELAVEGEEVNEVSEEGVQVESSSEFPAGDETNFTVDKEEKKGGTAAFVIIIVVAVLFIAGAIVWLVLNKKRKK